MSKQQDKINTIGAINLALDDAMAADANVIVLGEDVGDKECGGIVGVTKGLSTKYGDARVRSTPISEQAIIGAAIGAAIAGMRPVAEIMLMNFTTVAMDMIVNHAAKLRFMSGGQTHVPLVIRTMTGAGFGTGGQHADYLEAWFAHTAGIKVVAPSNPADAYGLMLSCIADDDPCLFIENMPTYWNPGAAPERGVAIPLGKANVLRTGTDVTLISYSRRVQECAVVAENLAKQGVSVELIDLRTISPLDTETILTSVAKTGRAVVVHEAVKPFGVGAEIASRIYEALLRELKAPVQRVGAVHCPVPYSKPLEEAFVPGLKEIEAAIRATLA
ncbi:pyruvate dehydrogenase [Herbaspirillum rubrisubalbicans]|uniref:Pyruvate dehydrogenase n=2 Tax=Herbaspirillum rubrisubalbicans TaxID=80842 RepID=A0ABX9C7T0_9BURK|nr:pyruvate dehydrogenase complex E1 component subunit beta [Herbaspirillum rubrisubalbicans]MCP1572905.1 pyruvate dehydrogenase E1 component beta subunit [Herbaspirillum rubrisubalbicans]NQE47240.1 pyruvate dehydrogenase [Herbaspirillum rubrisubalbicans]QJQ01470.1 alpha-ketoacid dehydrogenase subunit beta [Herbaspirillum rubrisubalbicans Os34]RAM66807.1 pyruvate dehydrogenase [Herbaspirillum rubrisubalbicans]RAN47466.1 pyruvate dehydrogenase [Herbaspirillum rubrisubalbicans]